MGKLIKGTTVKVDGQSGPLGKGVPLAVASGPGGLIGLAHGKKIQSSMQVTGFKPFMQRGLDRSKIKAAPTYGRSFFKPRTTKV